MIETSYDKQDKRIITEFNEYVRYQCMIDLALSKLAIRQGLTLEAITQLTNQYTHQTYFKN